MTKISFMVLRFVLVIAALSYVFKETGWATVALLTIMLIQVELIAIVVAVLIKETKETRNVSS